MFLFDWPKILVASSGKTREIFRIFKMLVEKQIPKNYRDPIYKYSQKDFSGESFMLHPDILLYHSYKYHFSEIAQYIALCSYRTTGAYLATGEVSLDVVFVPTEITKLLEYNRLLYVKNDCLHFLYEEVSPKEIH